MVLKDEELLPPEEEKMDEALKLLERPQSRKRERSPESSMYDLIID